MKSNLCQGINIYRAINAYKPNSTMIRFNSANYALDVTSYVCMYACIYVWYVYNYVYIYI